MLTLQIFRDLLDKGAFFRCKLNLYNTNIMICFIWFTYLYVLLVIAIRNEIYLLSCHISSHGSDKQGAKLIVFHMKVCKFTVKTKEFEH